MIAPSSEASRTAASNAAPSSAATEIRQQDLYPIHKIKEWATQVGPRFSDLGLAHLERLGQSLIV